MSPPTPTPPATVNAPVLVLTLAVVADMTARGDAKVPDPGLKLSDVPAFSPT